VAAALARRSAAGSVQILIAQRPPGAWQAGRWEFPGGKVEPGESDEVALRRELAEELGIVVVDAAPVGAFAHTYPDRSVEIALWVVREFAGEPSGLDGQALRWVPVDALAACDLLEADIPMIAPLARLLA
jgi:8-oxo-dGTP diphosphatase